jgi:iron complex outermembrane receptor protein
VIKSFEPPPTKGSRSNPARQKRVLRLRINTAERNGAKLELGLSISNLFNRIYAPNGYTFWVIIGGERNSFNYLLPQAGRNFMLMLSI